MTRKKKKASQQATDADASSGSTVNCPSRRDADRVCENSQIARKLLDMKEYEKALVFYNRAIERNPPNLADLCKQRNVCLHFLKKMAADNVLFKSIQSYAQDQAKAKLLDQEKHKRPDKNEDLYCEQEVLIKAYSFYEVRDFSQALESFRLAQTGRITKAEASFCLAEMIFNGQGTPRDIYNATTIFEETALLPHENLLDTYNNYRNVGVCESRYFLGAHFQEISGQYQSNVWNGSLLTASLWYWLGYQSGHALSSHALALMYLKGSGVRPSDACAEFYWKAAAEHGYHKACIHLAKLYIQQLEYEKAKSIIKFGMNIKDVEDKTKDILSRLLEEVYSLQTAVNYVRRMKELKIFEVNYPANEELSLYQRFQRMDNLFSYSSKNHYYYTNNHWGKLIALNTDSSIFPMEPSHYEDLCWRSVLDESVHAENMLLARMMYSNMLKVLEDEAESQTKLTDNLDRTNDFVLSLRHLLKISPSVIKWDNETLTTVYSMLRDIHASSNRKQSDFLKALEVCLAEIGAKNHDDRSGFKFLIRAWTLYPDEVQLSITLADHYNSKKEFEKAYMATAEAIEKFPDHVDLLFSHAQNCLLASDEIGVIECPVALKRRAIEHFIKFLDFAPVDHPKVPEVYYILGKIYYDMYVGLGRIADSIIVAKHYLNVGENAEQTQLKLFLPYKSELKDFFCKIVSESQSSWPVSECELTGNALISARYIRQLVGKDNFGKGNVPSVSKNDVEELKSASSIAEDSKRVELVVRLRENIKSEFAKIKNKRIGIYYSSSFKEIRRAGASTEADMLLPISVREGSSHPNKKWEDRVLYLTVIDEALSGFGLDDIVLVAEDSSRDVIQVLLRHFQQDEFVQRKFGFGCKLTILKPTFKDMFGEKIVEVYDHNGVMYDDSLRNQSLCRYCLKPGAKQTCSRCCWANYCDKECQMYDWKVLKHKKICHMSPPWNMDLSRRNPG